MNLLYANDRPGAYPDSLYAAQAPVLDPFPALEGAMDADVCIVGAGYTGLSAALALAEAGQRVVVLEAQRVGFGASGRNGGQVGTGQRIPQKAIEKRYGPAGARALWDLAEAAKAEVRHLIDHHGIDCALTPGVAFASRRAGLARYIDAEISHLSGAYGYDQMEPLNQAEITAHTGSEVFACGAIDRGAAHLNPLHFVLGLARAALAQRVKIFEGSEATGLIKGKKVRVATPKGHVWAKHVILAGNGYLGRLDRRTARRVMPINNFIVATEPLGDRFPEILPENTAAADDRFVVRYWRMSEDRRLVFGGGETYGYAFPGDIAAMVRPSLAEIYPQLSDIPLDYAWGGTLAITRTRMPHVARIAPNILTAGGYSGHGVALATLMGRILAEAIQGDPSSFKHFEGVKNPAFPGGFLLRTPLLGLVMGWFALLDRLGR